MANVKALVYALIAITVSAGLYLYKKRQQHLFPAVNDYANDHTRNKAYARYEAEAKELIATGLTEHQGPITILTPGGPKVILPASLTDWVKANKDLDHPELVKDDYLSDYPGFEAQTAVHHSDRILINVIKSKLSKNEGSVTVLDASLSEALKQYWGDSEAWHLIDWQQDTTGIISRAAASVFVGPDLAKDTEWQRVTIKYVIDYFTAVGQLRRWPASIRPIAHYFNPFSRACKQGMRQVRDMLREEMVGRRAAKASGAIYNDAIEWTSTAAGDKDIDQAALQLGLAIAALFTTSEALRQTVIELCKNTDIIPAMREEIQQAISEFGWTMSALFKMKLLDSVMKESQRTLPSLVGLERKTLRQVTLPNGSKIPAGTHLAVDSSLMWSSDIHTAPERFDGRRFLALREKTGASVYGFTASTKEHNVFGLGRFICPGRFFADTELKIRLAHILLEYDFRLKEGYVPASTYSGVFPMVDPFAKVEIRRVYR